MGEWWDHCDSRWDYGHTFKLAFKKRDYVLQKPSFRNTFREKILKLGPTKTLFLYLRTKLNESDWGPCELVPVPLDKTWTIGECFDKYAHTDGVLYIAISVWSVNEVAQ